MGQELKEGIMRSVKLAIGSMQKFAQSHWSQAEAAVSVVNSSHIKRCVYHLYNVY